MSQIEREISGIKDTLLQQDSLKQYIPSKGGTKALPDTEGERKLLLYSAFYTILALSSLPIAGMTEPYIELLELLGQSGYSRAYYELGLLFYHGDYVDKDFKRSFDYHHKAAEAGHSDAQFELYVYLSKGLGCTVDEAEALQWNIKAAEQGQNRAQYNMGAFYAMGTNAMPLDMSKALEWYQKASDAGNSQATITLGTMFYTGRGIPRNKERGLLYLQRASEQDVSFASRVKKYIRQLDSEGDS
jgi:TPR repeat protein